MAITKKMKAYLIKRGLVVDVEAEENAKSKIKHCVYMNRMQKRIDRELDMMLWLAIHYPQTFLDEAKEHKDSNGKVQANRRLKNLILTIKAVKPKMDVVLVLNNLEIPEELKA